MTDFNRAQGDRILIEDGHAWTIEQTGADAVIHVGDATMVLVGVNAASLTGDWIGTA